jgi:HlyD family secretion protein
MANSHPDTSNDTPPWDDRRNATAKSRLRRLLPWLIGLAIIAAVVFGLKPKPVEVETGVVARAPLTVRVSEEGKTRIRNRYTIASPVAGRLRRVPLKAGDEVKANETVITTIEPVVSPLLEPRERAQAEAVVAGREAARERAAQALQAAQSTLRLAELERDRYRSIRREGSVSQAERDRVESEASIRAADVRGAEFALRAAEQDLAQARAVLERPAGSLTGNVVEVKSPVSGRVLKLMQESETIATPGLAIAEVGDPADLEIEAEILSRDAVAIRPGDEVSIEQWGGPVPLKARVRRVEPAAFTKISALGVEEQRVYVLCDPVDPPAEAKALGDRFRVEVRVTVWHRDDVPVVPSGALFREGNAWKTFVFKDGRAKVIQLEAGRTDGHFTEVVSGLNVGDEVLLHPPDSVKDDTRVVKRGE